MADGGQVPPAQGGPHSPAPCSPGRPQRPSLGSKPIPTPPLPRVSTAASRWSLWPPVRAVLPHRPTQCWGRRPELLGGSRWPRGARRVAPPTPQDTQVSALAGGTPPPREWKVGLCRGRRQVLLQPSRRVVTRLRLPGFQSLGRRGAVSAPVCPRTHSRDQGAVCTGQGVPSTALLLEGSLPAIRVRTRLPGSPGSLRP